MSRALLKAVLLGVALTGAAHAGDGVGPGSNQTAGAGAMAGERSNVATEDKAATYRVRNAGTAAEALEVTARPLAGEPASSYLVQVFVKESAKPADSKPFTETLVGSFSFLPIRVGQSQTFVLPKPVLDDASAGKDLTLSVKLVSANASRTLKGTAVEIVDAQLVK